MPRGVPKAKDKIKRGAKLGYKAFIATSVKYLKKLSADAREIVMNQIADDLRSAAGRVEKKAAGARKPRTVAQEQRALREAGASTTENTSGGAKRTQPKVKSVKPKGSTRRTGASSSADDVSGIPGVAEESTSH